MTERAINRLRELLGLPIVPPPGLLDPPPPVATLLDASTVKGLRKLHDAQDNPPDGGASNA